MLWVLFLLVAWGAAALSCLRLCLAAASVDRARDPGDVELTLYETAFLTGGPHRVADLALVTMHLRRRLLLAHTGWATVVDPEGRDEVERTVIRAIGPEGSRRYLRYVRRPPPPKPYAPSPTASSGQGWPCPAVHGPTSRRRCARYVDRPCWRLC